MKKTAKTRIAAAAMTLVMLTSLSAVAFADGPQGGPQMGGMHMNQQMGGNGPMGGMQGAPSQSFAPSGSFHSLDGLTYFSSF